MSKVSEVVLKQNRTQGPIRKTYNKQRTELY